MSRLSELVAQRREERVRSLSAKYNSLSLIDFTDLTPLDQKEIDLFWPYEGSELERQIALRLATRTAEETIKALTAKWSGSNGPCHKCGESKLKCRCLVRCPRCWVRHYRDSAHTCDEKRVEEIANDPFSHIFHSIRQV